MQPRESARVDPGSLHVLPRGVCKCCLKECASVASRSPPKQDVSSAQARLGFCAVRRYLTCRNRMLTVSDHSIIKKDHRFIAKQWPQLTFISLTIKNNKLCPSLRDMFFMLYSSKSSKSSIPGASAPAAVLTGSPYPNGEAVKK